MVPILKNNRILISILVLGFVLRIFNLSYPASPVFDETHFATYASAYARGKAHIDIHPPLGKIIYSIPLFFSDSPEADFFRTETNPETGRLDINLDNGPYRNFPYLPLRLISVLFGILLTLAFYLFLKNLSGERSIALWGAFFMTLENSILLETRLILLNGMYLAFGFFSLSLFIREKQKMFWGGLLLGLALSVKLIAIVFFGPIIFWVLSRPGGIKEIDWRKFFTFSAVAFGIFLMIVLGANSLFIPVRDRTALYENYFDWVPSKKEIVQNRLTNSIVAPHLRASIIESNFFLSGYAYGESHPSESEWVSWPFMNNPIGYYPLENNSKDPKLILLGNPFVWGLGTIAMIFGMILAIKKLGKFVGERSRTFAVLIGGYIFSLLPFILVQRSTFLYHYFPALLFSIGLAAVFVSDHLKILSPKRRRIISGLIICLAVFSFLIISPFTYGL